MLVKKTKKGKFSFCLHFIERENLYGKMSSFLELESAKLPFVRLKDQNVVNRHLHYYVTEALFRKHYAALVSSSVEEKFSFTRCEALAILSFLALCDGNIELQELKSGLHKLLS